jgi:hypothetical protein
MNLADVFTFLFVILGFVIVFVCYWLMAAGVAPEFVGRAADQLRRGAFRSTALGLVTMIPLIVIGALISQKASNGVLKIIGITIVLLPLLFALFGSAGWALRVGTGLKSRRDEREPWRRVLRGGIVLGITFVLPFIGTFVLMPLVFLSGFGAFILALRGGAPVIAQAPVAAPILPPAPMPIPVNASAPAAALSTAGYAE